MPTHAKVKQRGNVSLLTMIITGNRNKETIDRVISDTNDSYMSAKSSSQTNMTHE
jgi:coenzyme F420-reducing hydrogenase alpha subunit